MIHHRHRLWNSKIQLLSELLLPKAVIEPFVRNPQGSLSAMRMPTGALTRQTSGHCDRFTNTLSIELGVSTFVPMRFCRAPRRVHGYRKSSRTVRNSAVNRWKKKRSLRCRSNRSNGLSIRAVLRHQRFSSLRTLVSQSRARCCLSTTIRERHRELRNTKRSGSASRSHMEAMEQNASHHET
jgi:hypothetical protein